MAPRLTENNILVYIMIRPEVQRTEILFSGALHLHRFA